MPIRTGIPDSESVNMTPMIDVVFNLLIFFLLSATYFHEESELELSLPKVKSAAPVTSSPRDLKISVLADGRVQIEGDVVDATGLEARLRGAKENYPDQAVSIRGDGAARHQWVADVLAICRRVGIRRIDVLVQQEH